MLKYVLVRNDSTTDPVCYKILFLSFSLSLFRLYHMLVLSCIHDLLFKKASALDSLGPVFADAFLLGLPLNLVYLTVVQADDRASRDSHAP